MKKTKYVLRLILPPIILNINKYILRFIYPVHYKNGGIYERVKGNITILSTHLILDQLGYDLLNGLDFNPSKKIIIYCGIHNNFGWHWFRSGLKIGIQTEQFYDESGRVLWAIKKTGLKFNLSIAILFCSRVLDLSDSNIIYYTTFFKHKILDKITLGPHIFPNKKIDYKEGFIDSYLFLANSDDTLGRRLGAIKILRSHHKISIDYLSRHAFFEDLYLLIKPYKGILNIHFDEGVYSEAPRLLIAYFSGKIFLSEKLSSIFTSGEHYIELENYTGNENLELIYEQFSKYVRENFSFEKFLSNCTKKL